MPYRLFVHPSVRSGVLVIDVSATGPYVDGGRLRAMAWMYGSAIGLWTDGDPPPDSLADAARHAGLTIGYDLHGIVVPLVWRRWDIRLRSPRIDLRRVTGLTPAELACSYPPRQPPIALPGNPDLASALRRLLVLDAAWQWIRSQE